MLRDVKKMILLKNFPLHLGIIREKLTSLLTAIQTAVKSLINQIYTYL